LFTRSQTLSDPFIPAFLQAGGTLYALPTLTITPIHPRSVLDKWLSRCPTEAVCIFVSRHAIACIGPSLKQAPQWPNICSVCLGPGSRQALLEQGIPNRAIISPVSRPYETEALLAHPFFLEKSAQNQQYWIFRGPPGRTLLQNTLKAQGAKIQEIALYNRDLATLNPLLRDEWETALTNHNVTLVSSAEGLENLMTRVKQLAKKSLKVRLLKQRLLLPSARVAQLAKFHGFRYITEIGSLETQSLLNALKTVSS
jgi:uroporphyrinogen-III synthase